MAGVVWLASYPKSGTTWLRAFLANYQFSGEAPIALDDLADIFIASARDIFDRVTGIEASDLTPIEIDRYRPWVYERLASENDDPLFIKVHDAWRCNSDGKPLFPASVTTVVIYLIRNPLDVAPSYAHHYGVSIEQAISDMGDEALVLAQPGGRLERQLYQLLFSWSDHVYSWVDESGLPVHIVRYEDIVRAPEEAFTGILSAAGLLVEPARMQKALEFSRFERLHAQEATEGFKERLPWALAPFFRKGKVGSWREELTQEQAWQLIGTHKKVMRRFGYLTEEDEPVF